MTDESTDPELEAAATEELANAVRMSWAELSRLAPWGDIYEGFGPAGGAVVFERSYMWLEAPGGDILCEVVAHRGPSRYERGVKASRIIPRPN